MLEYQGEQVVSDQGLPEKACQTSCDFSYDMESYRLRDRSLFILKEGAGGF